jgi:hypothetical protein
MMANFLIPIAERQLTPAEVAVLDARRRRGHLFLVMGFQFLLVSAFVLLWSGQDATYSPGWHRPMLFWDILVFALACVFLGKGIALRRGVNEFFSY